MAIKVPEGKEGTHEVEVTVFRDDAVISQAVVDFTPEQCPICTHANDTNEEVRGVYGSTESYRDGWDATFGGRKKEDLN
ncbi:MAG: hypothetical protein GWP15_01300 [Nitrospirae bacterium]|nr:hypothetical protein [Nitrospirota bacterium]